MPAFNRVLFSEHCDKCGLTHAKVVQFRYGRVWQIDYKIGDQIEWGKNSVGNPTGNVVVDGIAENIVGPCGSGIENYYVFIADSVIEDVRAADGKYDFSNIEEGWISR